MCNSTVEHLYHQSLETLQKSIRTGIQAGQQGVSLVPCLECRGNKECSRQLVALDFCHFGPHQIFARGIVCEVRTEMIVLLPCPCTPCCRCFHCHVVVVFTLTLLHAISIGVYRLFAIYSIIGVLYSIDVYIGVNRCSIQYWFLYICNRLSVMGVCQRRLSSSRRFSQSCYYRFL